MPNSKCDPNCKVQQAFLNSQTQKDPIATYKTSQSMNHGVWEGHSNEKKFMDALANLMNESWSIVCQIREQSGLNAQFVMSSTEINKRIEEVSKKLDEKYKEIAFLEEQKQKLLTKTPAPSQQSGYSYPESQLGYMGGYQYATSLCPARQTVYQTAYQGGLSPQNQMGYLGNVMSYGEGGPSAAVTSRSQKRSNVPSGSSSTRKYCSPDCQGSPSSSAAYSSYGFY